MIDDTLGMRPGGKRSRQRVVRVEVHRAIQQIDGTRVAAAIERERMRHGSQRQIVSVEVGLRFPPGALDLGQPQVWLQRRRDPRRMMLLENEVVPQDAIGAMRPDVAPCLGLDQPKAQARLPVRFSQGAGQMVACPSLDESNAVPPPPLWMR